MGEVVPRPDRKLETAGELEERDRAVLEFLADYAFASAVRSPSR